MRVSLAGFSLIEVLISLMLISVAALGFVRLQTYVERQIDYVSNAVNALHLAETQLEWFRTRGVSSALTANFDRDVISGQTWSAPFYTVSWAVAAAPLSASLKSISVSVSWPDRHGTPQHVELSTLLSRYSEFDTSMQSGD